MRFLVLSLLVLAVAAQTCSLNNCVSFTVGPGTGCDWMCNYCANTLGTSSYYFTTPVCAYASGGCIGDPVSGVQYTCCST
jgi:hypothetical protein